MENINRTKNVLFEKKENIARWLAGERGVLCEYETKWYFDKHFGIIIGKKLMMPKEYLPNREFLAYHQEKVFMGVWI